MPCRPVAFLNPDRKARRFRVGTVPLWPVGSQGLFTLIKKGHPALACQRHRVARLFLLPFLSFGGMSQFKAG